MEITMTKAATRSSEFIDIGALDRTLAEHGAFTVLDWLLAEGRLPYADYAAWREGRRASLDDALTLAAVDLDRLLTEVDGHAQALHLNAESRELFTWSATTPEPLKASKRAEAHRRIVQQWRRARPTPQFDLFMDNAAAATESRLCDAIGGLRLDVASRELDSLSRLDATNKSLGDYQDLINYGRHLQTPPPTDQPELQAELDGLEREVQPLARSLLGANARDYLARAWRRLATGLMELPSAGDGDDRLHASHALAQIPDWAAVRSCLEAEPRLLRQPAWLQRLARACRATGQPELGLLWWLVRIDRHPQDAATALETCDDPVLSRLWSDYQELAERLQIDPIESGFSGFVLLRRPGLIHSLGAAAPLEMPATRAMIQLIEARRNGQDEMALRKALAAISQALLSLYLSVAGR
jgi:hypothetical protein